MDGYGWKDEGTDEWILLSLILTIAGKVDKSKTAAGSRTLSSFCMTVTLIDGSDSKDSKSTQTYRSVAAGEWITAFL